MKIERDTDNVRVMIKNIKPGIVFEYDYEIYLRTCHPDANTVNLRTGELIPFHELTSVIVRDDAILRIK